MVEKISIGGCLCGAVRFEAAGEPWRVGLCHCMTCRKESGSVFNAFAIFPAAQVRISGRPTRAVGSSLSMRSSKAMPRPSLLALPAQS